MRSVLFVAALLAAPVVMAQQSVALTFRGTTSTSSVAFNRSACDESRSVTVDYAVTSGAALCEPLIIWVTTQSSCQTTPPTGADANNSTNTVIATVSENTVNTTRNDDVSLAVRSLPIFFGKTDPCAEAVEQEMRVCAHFKAQNVTTACDLVGRGASPPVVRYDALPPDAPTLATPVAAGDGVFRPRLVDPDAEINEYRVIARPVGAAPDGGTLAEVSSQRVGREAIAEIRGVTNGVQYALTAVATDEAGNESDLSTEVLAVAAPTQGFLDAYDGAGGGESGGCTASGGGLVAAALLAVAGALRARNGRRS